MERGDLATFVRPNYIIVLEGVLAIISPIEEKRRWGRTRPVAYNIHWMDIPLRRLATMQRQWPDVGAEIVTFVSEDVAQMAADFLDSIPLAYDSLRYHSFKDFRTLLPYRDGVQAIFDSDPDRLDRYGQLGHAVLRGEDF